MSQVSRALQLLLQATPREEMPAPADDRQLELAYAATDAADQRAFTAVQREPDHEDTP